MKNAQQLHARSNSVSPGKGRAEHSRIESVFGRDCASLVIPSRSALPPLPGKDAIRQAQRNAVFLVIVFLALVQTATAQAPGGQTLAGPISEVDAENMTLRLSGPGSALAFYAPLSCVI